MTEKVLLQQSCVVVTNYRAIFGNVTYPITNITSVTTIEERDGVWKGVLGALGFVIGGGLITNNNWFGFVFLLLGTVGILWYFFKPEYKYWVRIGTSGTEINAIFYAQKNLTDNVVNALNSAIVERG